MMIKQFTKRCSIVGLLLLTFSATDSFAGGRHHHSGYQSYAYGYYQPYGTRLSYGYRSGYGRYNDYSYRRGFRDGGRFQRWRRHFRRRTGYYGSRYCPTPRRYRNW